MVSRSWIDGLEKKKKRNNYVSIVPSQTETESRVGGGGNVKKSFKKVLKKVKKKVSTFEEKGEFNSLSFIFPRNTTNFLWSALRFIKYILSL